MEKQIVFHIWLIYTLEKRKTYMISPNTKYPSPHLFRTLRMLQMLGMLPPPFVSTPPTGSANRLAPRDPFRDRQGRKHPLVGGSFFTITQATVDKSEGLGRAGLAQGLSMKVRSWGPSAPGPSEVVDRQLHFCPRREL